MINPVTEAKTHLQDANAQTEAGLSALQTALSLSEAVQTNLNAAIKSAMAAASGIQSALSDLSTTVIGGIDRTGTVDVTDGIQSFLDQGGKLYLPAGRYLIDAEKSLKPVSNTNLVLDPEAYLIAKPNANHHYKVIHLDAVNNVTITGGKLVGDRDEHTYAPVYLKDGVTLSSLSTHEWGHGIGIGGGDNITIRGVELYNFTGDGISAGSNRHVVPWIRGTNILIDSVDSHDNRRQGLSITNVNGIRVINSKFRRIGLGNGTSPKCGIDIEPDDDTNSTESGTCDNVWIENCLIADNALYGLNVFLRVSNVTVKNTRFVTNGSCGAVVVDGDNIVFDGNTFDRNASTGLFIKDGVDSFVVEGNTFHLNYSKQNPTLRTTPLTASGYTTAKRDLLITSVALPKGFVGANTYD